LPVEARVQLDDHIEAATLAVGLVDKCFRAPGPHAETVADLRNHAPGAAYVEGKAIQASWDVAVDTLQA
jgi:hypothetical protein